jgi:hypothetical protein
MDFFQAAIYRGSSKSKINSITANFSDKLRRDAYAALDALGRDKGEALGRCSLHIAGSCWARGLAVQTLYN